VDNQWIVPYSPFLCRLFDCHINIECVTSLGTFRYVFKYSNSTLLFGYFQLKLNFNHNQTQIIILSLKPSPSLYVPIHPVVPSVMSVPWSCTCACFNHVGFLSGSALSLVCILYLSYCQSVYLWLVLPNCGYPFRTNFFLYLMTTVSHLCANKPHASTCFPNTPTCHQCTPMCPASPHQFISC